MSGEIGVKLARQNYCPGERLEGQVAWLLPTPPKSVRIRLFWRTSGKGTRDLAVIEEHTVAAPQASQMERFAFDLPVEPYSFKGTLITLQWCVEAIADDASHSAFFEMGLDGAACILHNRP